ncbi:hypothetical protein Tco_1336378 [Tanacetum coccineum]
MLVLRLTTESESEAAFDLLKFIQKQIDEMLHISFGVSDVGSELLLDQLKDYVLVKDFAAAEGYEEYYSNYLVFVRVNINTVFVS